jgi:putative FmdB family regulatory protein
MPLYEYACQECGKESELLVNGSSQPACPKCGSLKVDKLLSIVAAPSRGGSPGNRPESSGGSCGSHCGCHPHG